MAFPVPLTQAHALDTIREQNSSLQGIRWTPLQNLHVTLFFLGEVEEENIPAISQSISKVTEQTLSFNIEFEKIILVERKKNAGMIWARFLKNEFFTTLSMSLHHTVKSFLVVNQVMKDFIPHITIARLKREAENEKINLSFDDKFSLPEINFCELWKTIQTKEGVVYKSLERFKLRKLSDSDSI